ncbi:MAG TPA: Hsp20/alpha crystallin family protein [Epsilonproteobacteria bacterium]|nr:Hsp20/alpha crystallin family protein [Campylobacterota bacterium]
MELVNTAKELGQSVEEKIEHGLEVAKDTFANVASHLPFANLAKRGNDTFKIEIDLPGVKKEDIELQVEENLLTIKAVRKMKNEVKKDDYYLCESNFGMISRSFVLPEGIDSSRVDAKYEDGRLYVTLEKEESRKAKSIAVK